jgi:hypothetical protein
VVLQLFPLLIGFARSQQQQDPVEAHAHEFRHGDLGEIRLDFELLIAIDTPNQFLVLHRTPTGKRGQPTAN